MMAGRPAANTPEQRKRNQDCPVWVEAKGVAQVSKDLVRRMRRLRKAMLACRGCTARQDCDFLQSFKAGLDVAIAEVTEEWGPGND
jgi:ribosomal protein L39E